jgi:5-methyltetrahydrofolate--homocysteine methyltransferase
MAKSVKEIFRQGTAVADGSMGVYMSDGGCGSELIKRGLTLGESTELWNITHRDHVLEVARAYVDAGADIILTNTFGGNRIIQQKHGLQARVAEFNKAAVAISKEASGGKALVFGSVGPLGRMVSMGEVSTQDAYAAFKEQVAALKEGGAEGIVVETVSDLEEFKAALKAAKESGLPVVGCMSFDSGKEFDRTMMGVSLRDMARAADQFKIDMIGANCGVGIEHYVKIAENLLRASRLPVWIKANAGLPVMENGRAIYKMSPKTFAGHAKALKKMGVRVVGGCCGTTPDHIRALKEALI